VNIGVLLKQVPDTETKIRVAGDGIEEGDVKWIINPYDEYAVEEAIRLKEKLGDGEVLIFSMGKTRTLDAARTALAMGGDRAVILDDDAFEGTDAYGTAKALAAAIEKEDCGIVFTGGQAIDLDQSAVPQTVAAFLGWPHASWIEGFEHNGDSATIRRAVGGGSVEVVDVALPAVLTCTKGLNDPRYASLPGIMKAKRKPVTNYSPDDLGVGDDVGADNNKVSLSNFQLPPGRAAGRILEGAIGDQVKELVRLLREEAKVL
jgi:electron transfer flavoprotein beta subunit